MSSLNIASRALTTNLAALQVVGHNIANVNTPGFSRQSVQLTTAGGQNTGSGYFGKGVEMVGVDRAYSSFLTVDALSTSSVAAGDEARYQRLQQLEALFPLGESSLGVTLNNALNAWNAVASSPTDSTARTVVISRAEELAARLRDTGAKLEDLRLTSSTQLEATRGTINTLATKIAEVNLRIVEASGAGRSPNDLLDQRDQLMADLNKHIQTTSVQSDDGSLTVFVAGSQPLVLGGRAGEIVVQRSDADPLRTDVFIRQAGQDVPLNESFLGGGSLKGILQFVNTDLPNAVNALGRLTVSLVEQVNAQHHLGLDLNGQPGGDIFTVAAMPTGVGTPGSAQITPTVVDPTALVATDYELRFTTATDGVLTRRADGSTQPFVVDTGTTPYSVSVDGLRFDIAAPASTQPGDVYTLRPYARAAASIDVAIAQPQSLAAASPVKLQTNLGLTSSLTVESLRLTGGSAAGVPVAGFGLVWNAGTGAFDVQVPPDPPLPAAPYNISVVTPPGPYSPGEPMTFTVNNNGVLASYSLTLRGAPQAGDSFSLSRGTGTEMNQNFGNAQGMLDLRDVPSFGGVTLADGYVSVFSGLAGTVQAGKFAAEFSTTAATNAETVRANYSAVNLDEEAARLLQYQQAYQAVAKFLQTAQSTFDVLINSFS
ncbi:flagellar hook-associated protein FlgK [Hydrogenophaga sp. OTU3427]|uniref:flagellar hook-associated protein FlgK n=1 Tax=Hydrogenophaga sp. OTU3427 TaxID=3043856 RepID=UPI00313B548D